MKAQIGVWFSCLTQTLAPVRCASSGQIGVWFSWDGPGCGDLRRGIEGLVDEGSGVLEFGQRGQAHGNAPWVSGGTL